MKQNKKTMKKSILAFVAATAIFAQIPLFAAEVAANQSVKRNTQTISDVNRITVEKAKEIALNHSGLKSSDVTFTKQKLDYDNGISYYEIEFNTGSKWYDYELAASDGTIEEYSVKFYSRKSAVPASTSTITLEKAKEIALNHLGLNSSDVTFTKTKQDNGKNNLFYDIEFVADTKKYDFEISGGGSIYEYSYNLVHSAVGSSSTDASGYIGTEAAKKIALDYAGISENQANFTKVKLDKDDGVVCYEIEFVANGQEYEFSINASTGVVLEFEIDH